MRDRLGAARGRSVPALGAPHTFMHTRYRRSSDATALLGVVAVVLGFWLFVYRDGFDTLGKGSFAIGVMLLFISFVLYVRAKGYPAWWCLLFFIATEPD